MIRGIIDNALDHIVAATNDRVLRDNGKEVILSDRDRVALIAAMEVARAVDEAYREEDGISIPADDFAKGGAWCRAPKDIFLTYIRNAR